MFKHKELQQQLMDTKLQRITEMMKEVEEKQQKERDLVSGSCPGLGAPVSTGQGCRGEGGWADVGHHKYGNTPYADVTECLQLLTDATESRRKCELMKEQEIRLKQQVGSGWVEGVLDLPGPVLTSRRVF